MLQGMEHNLNKESINFIGYGTGTQNCHNMQLNKSKCRLVYISVPVYKCGEVCVCKKN